MSRDYLTEKQELFVREYLSNGRSGIDAYRKAYSAKGSSDSIYVKACELLKHPKVYERVNVVLDRVEAKTEITVARVIEELAKIGFANMGDYMRATSKGDPYFDYAALTRDQTAALSEVTVEDYTDGRGEDAREVKRVKFKLADKRQALVDIGRTLGMFTDRHELEIGPNLEALMRGRHRAKAVTVIDQKPPRVD